MVSVDVVIPVLNEEEELARNVGTLHGYLSHNQADRDWRIVIADNGSTDKTLAIAEELAASHERIAFIHLTQKGRGRALRTAWLESQADVVSYMDLDLSTDINYFPSLLEAVIEEGYDIAIGSRLLRDSQVNRGLKREFLSWGYNLLKQVMFGTRVKDAQCGFKALSRKAAHELVPLVRDQSGFFDSELLIMAEWHRYKIKELPVQWNEDPESRFRIHRMVWNMFRGLVRVRFQMGVRPRKYT